MPIPAIVGSLLTNKYVLALIAAGALFIYIQNLRWSVDSLTTEKAALESTVKTQAETIKHIKEDVEKVTKSRDEIAKEKEKLDKETKELTDTLHRENKKKKSLEELALKKTSLIQLKVNKATKEVFECFELISNGGDC